MNQPGLSYEALGEVQMWNLNCIFEALLISEMDDILTLSFTQPLWLGDANTGTPLGAPLGDGASLDIVLVYPPPEAVLSGAMYVPVIPSASIDPIFNPSTITAARGWAV